MVKTSVEFVEFENKNLKGYTLVEGFPGMGLVGTIAAKYLVEKAKFKQIGYIRANIFVPIIRIHKGMPVHPSRIFVNDDEKLVVIISEQVIPKMSADPLARAVSEWVEHKGITKVISLSGIQGGGNKEMVYGIAANKQSLPLLEKHKIKPIEEGITTGVTALILLYLRRKNIEAISIMGNVSIAADYKAAANLMHTLNEVLGLRIDVEPLMKEAKKMEAEIIKHLEKLRRTKDSVEKFETKTPMYT